MSEVKEGDRVRVITRPVTDEDRKKNRYYEHMAGSVGTVQTVYSVDEVSIKVDPESMSDITADVHKTATLRMRNRFLNELPENQKKTLTQEELDFNAHYVLLVQMSDLEKV